MFLDEVIASTRARCATLPVDFPVDDAPPVRSLANAIMSCPDGRAIIAEIKPVSPAHGRLRTVPDHAGLARELVAGGAAALSVLTEPLYFGGASDRLAQLRSAIEVPLLRKEFIIDERQLPETRALGGDAVLLMAKVLGDRLVAFVDLAREIGLEPLVEVQMEAEVELALGTDARLVGINNRDLTTLRVDLGTTSRLSPSLRDDGRTVVSMSGISSAADLLRLAPHCDAFLIGSALMWAPSPRTALEALRAL
ncbi:MAG: indole-3-glycerol-phosphate synthase [Methanospirillum sp.]